MTWCWQDIALKGVGFVCDLEKSGLIGVQHLLFPPQSGTQLAHWLPWRSGFIEVRGGCH